MFSSEVRQQIYTLLAPLQVVLVSFGVLSDESATLWAAMVTAALGLGLAAINSHNWRKYLYGFLAPAQAIVMYYGIVSEHQAASIAALAAAALGIGLAAAKTPEPGV
jgi:uncharacterized membrane protein YjjB (DUF3815 family)